MRIPVIEVTGPTFARITDGMTVIPYQSHVVEPSGRYVACDLTYGEISPFVQKDFAFITALDDALPESKLVVFHVLPSMHDFFESFGWLCGFAYFDVSRMDDERKHRYFRRHQYLVWHHRELMKEFKKTCAWCEIESNFRLLARPCECGCPCTNGNFGVVYDEDIPF